MTNALLAAIGLIQALMFFILADLRGRIARLEEMLMPPVYAGERRKSHA